MTGIGPALREEEEPIDVKELASRPRRVTGVPDPWEVRSAIEFRLQPAEVYRLRWQLPPVEEPSDS